MDLTSIIAISVGIIAAIILAVWFLKILLRIVLGIALALAVWIGLHYAGLAPSPIEFIEEALMWLSEHKQQVQEALFSFLH